MGRGIANRGLARLGAVLPARALHDLNGVVGQPPQIDDERVSFFKGWFEMRTFGEFLDRTGTRC